MDLLLWEELEKVDLMSVKGNCIRFSRLAVTEHESFDVSEYCTVLWLQLTDPRFEIRSGHDIMKIF